jgi:hypothetical protein
MKIAGHFVDAIKSFGYTAAEARFLYIVATHSGYFTTRHFLAFTDSQRGFRTRALTKKLLENKHANSTDCLDYGRVYHVFSKPFYAAIGKENLRNRRAHSFHHVTARLLGLSFILENLEYDYFETETDKVEYFCNALKVKKQFLPVRIYDGAPGTTPTVRYFVDKFPLFLAPVSGTSSSPVVTFTYVDADADSLDSFLTHLCAYQPLFRELREFRFLFISAAPTNFGRACAKFRSLVIAPFEVSALGDVIRYFQVRKAWENREYVTPVASDLEFLRTSMERYQGEHFEKLFQRWKAGNLSDTDLEFGGRPNHSERNISFDTYLIRERGLLPVKRPSRPEPGAFGPVQHPVQIQVQGAAAHK